MFLNVSSERKHNVRRRGAGICRCDPSYNRYGHRHLLDYPIVRWPAKSFQFGCGSFATCVVKVSELAECRTYPALLSACVKDVFRKIAQGAFLWVGLVAKELKKYKFTEVNGMLEQFPPGLDGLYARMLLQIGNSRREFAAKTLKWVVMAKRPLTLRARSCARDRYSDVR